jgi:hypothetical protein
MRQVVDLMQPASPGGQGAPRCSEQIRGPEGFARCHRRYGHAGRHHVRDRSWDGLASAAPGLQFGVACDAGCLFGDEVTAYLGRRPGGRF